MVNATADMLSADAPDPLIGAVLMDRYRILKVLGEGGMGRVYLAEQKMGAAFRKVAIKTLHPDLSRDAQLVARFHRESETVITLSHPNTIQFYDFGELPDGTLFIVMEYIEGESLGRTLERGAMDLARVDKIVTQICGSLHEAHQLGVIHRDLKPDNVLLTKRAGYTDFVKVLDFGIAKRSEAEIEDQVRTKLTRQGMVLGTPPYMSPEQFSGQALDVRSDVYSLGIMVYEMLTAQLPFVGNTPWEWASQHLTAPPAPIENFPIAAQMPPSKKTALMRALAKKRDDRPGDVIQFLREFTGRDDSQSAWNAGVSAPTTGSSGVMQAPTQSGMMPRASGVEPTLAVSTGSARVQSGYQQAQVTGATGNVAATYESQIGTALPTTSPIKAILGGLFVIGLGIGGFVVYRSMELTTSSTSTPATPTSTASEATNSHQTKTAAEKPAQAAQTEETAEPETSKAAASKNSRATKSSSSKKASRPATTTPKSQDLSPAQESSGKGYVSAALAALASNNVPNAIATFTIAQQILGKKHPELGDARKQIQRKGANAVGIYIQQGQCPQAQTLYKQLQKIGAEANAKNHFSPEWCPRP